MENTSRQEEWQVHSRACRRVLRAQALIGRRLVNDQRLLSQQGLAEHLLPPVVHLSWKVIRVPSKQLVPQSLQQDAVLWRIPKEKNIYISITACDIIHCCTHSGLYLWLIAVGDYFEYTPLQVFHVGNAQSVQSRADGFKEKKKNKKHRNMKREPHSRSSVYNDNNRGDSNIVSIGL